MGFSPMRTGATWPPLDMLFLDDEGASIQLPGVQASNVSVSFYNLDTQQTTVGTGTVTIIDNVDGEIQYSFATPDTATPGRYEVRVTVHMPLVNKDLIPDPQELIII